MEDKFIKVKNRVKSDGLSSDTIAKVLKLMEFSKENNVDLYLSDEGKLRMKLINTEKKEEKTGLFDGILDDLLSSFNGKKK